MKYNVNKIKKIIANDYQYLTKDLDKSDDNNVITLYKQLQLCKNFISAIAPERANKIKVQYSMGNASYTSEDGPIYISGSTKRDDVPVTIGLTLHELSHKLYTNFTHRKTFKDIISFQHLSDLYKSYAMKMNKTYDKNSIKVDFLNIKNENEFKIAEYICNNIYIELVEKLNIDRKVLDTVITPKYINMYLYMELSGNLSKFYSLINILEDRRIDSIMWKKYAGYRSYYIALYLYYFWDVKTLKAIQSKESRNVTINNYLFHILSFINKNRDLTALPRLKDIYDILDLKNINKKSSEDIFVDGIKIFQIIYEEVYKNNDVNFNDELKSNAEIKNDTDLKFKNDYENSNNNSEYSEGDGDSDEDEFEEDYDDDFDDIEDYVNEINNNIMDEVTDDTLDEILDDDNNEGDDENMVDVVNDVINKTIQNLPDDITSDDIIKIISDNKRIKSIKSSVFRELKSIIDNTASIVNLQNSENYQLDVIVIKDIKDIDTIGAFSQWGLSNRAKKNEDIFNSATHDGRLIAKQLNILNDTRNVYSRRRTHGNIDNRLLSEYKMTDKLFYNKFTENTQKSFIHLSLDVSGSIEESMYHKIVKFSYMMAIIANQLHNMKLQISIRYASMHNDSNPYVIYMYDSNKNTLADLRQRLNLLKPTGATPEALCFEAITKQLVIDSAGYDNKYLISITDGYPSFATRTVDYSISTYDINDFYSLNEYIVTNSEVWNERTTVNTLKHINVTINKIFKLGINFMNYFVTSDKYGHTDTFSKVYDDAYMNTTTLLNDTNITKISNDLNKLLIESKVLF